MTFDGWWEKQVCFNINEDEGREKSIAHMAWNAAMAEKRPASTDKFKLENYELEQLREELAATKLECARQLSNQDYEYNRKTNALIERHANQLLAAQMVIEQMREALENIRLFAARRRNEEWAKIMLRFCSEGGATGSPLRSTEALRDRDRKRDAALLQSLTSERNHTAINDWLLSLATDRESGEWEPDLKF